MSTPQDAFAAELKRYGPDGDAPRPTLADAQAYCRRLARRHYENFTVASWLLPGRIRQHFFNVYAYCRWADDLADETAGGRQTLDLLDWWENQLNECYQRQAEHPVMLALAETVQQFAIPIEPLSDLLVAFRRDQRQHRYETFDELLDYCRFSANPVGRIVLYLGQCHNDQTIGPSDAICTGLQLANFWQDVARDFDRGRVYLPAETLRRFGGDPEQLSRRRADRPFREALAHEVDRAESYLTAGRPLLDAVPVWLRVDVALFIDGGRAILRAIRRLDYDVWTRRPTVSRTAKLRLLFNAWRNRGVRS